MYFLLLFCSVPLNRSPAFQKGRRVFHHELRWWWDVDHEQYPNAPQQSLKPKLLQTELISYLFYLRQAASKLLPYPWMPLISFFFLPTTINDRSKWKPKSAHKRDMHKTIHTKFQTHFLLDGPTSTNVVKLRWTEILGPKSNSSKQKHVSWAIHVR